MSKRGQVTIFIIVAVVLVALAGIFFTIDKSKIFRNLPPEIEPVYNSFLSCLEENALTGVSILESDGGYIELPEFESGSTYMPFSSRLNLFGNSIPYWYYVSGNNMEKEQVPSKEEMEGQLAKYVEDQVIDCDLEEFYEQGYLVYFGQPKAEVGIRDEKINIDLEMDLRIEKDGETTLIEEHKLSLDAVLGKLYDNAVKVYEQQSEELFLEDYGIDVLRSYAPVDGVELSCSPKVWNAEQIFNELQEAIEANTLFLETEEDYFDLDLNTNVEVRFRYSPDWSYSFEVNPSSGNFLVAKPVGIQPGLEILGFCYVPYHFVYDLKYPVLIQLSDSGETFQFPMAVIIAGNNKRSPFEGNASVQKDAELCKNRNTPLTVNVYDSNSNPIEAFVSYECFGQTCDIGKSPLTEDVPQCVNGYVLATAEGYADESVLFSTVNSGTVSIFMEEKIPLSIDLKVGGISSEDRAVIYFNSEDGSTQAIAYPEHKTIELVSGKYDIEVYVYEESSLSFEATTLEQCIEVPRSGVAGVLGLTSEECTEVEVPSQALTNVLIGGGKSTQSVSRAVLESSDTIELSIDKLKSPEDIEDLYGNYLAFEDLEVGVEFK